MKRLLALCFALVLACTVTSQAVGLTDFGDDSAPNCNPVSLTVIGIQVANNGTYYSGGNQYDDFCIQNPANNHWYFDANFDANNSGSTTDIGDHWLFNCCVTSFEALNQQGAKMNVWFYSGINYTNNGLQIFPWCATIPGHTNSIWNNSPSVGDVWKSMKIKWGTQVHSCDDY